MVYSNALSVMVTGAAQGIGKGISRYLLEHGHTVLMVDRDQEAGERALAEYAPLSTAGKLYFVLADISQESEVATAMRFAEQHAGGLGALVNNAGIASPRSAAIEQLTLAEWNRILATNLTGVFLMVKHAVPLLRKSGGVIVNIASTRAIQSEPYTEAYAASKGGIVALTHALAISLGPEIRVNCISPGWIDVRQWQKTPSEHMEPLSDADHRQHPVGRVGRPEDVANLVGFLLSGDAGFITGQNFVVDGGMVRKMIYV